MQNKREGLNFSSGIFNKYHFKVFLFSPVAIAMVVSAMVLLVFPVHVRKYELEVLRTEMQQPKSKIYHIDLDHDGTTEKVKYINFHDLRAALLLYSHDEKIIDQWNAEHVYIKNSKLAHGDYDHDGFEEIYMFTHKEDSLFLNITEYLDEDGMEMKGKYLFQMPLYENKIGYSVEVFNMFDNDNDGFDELYMWFWNGFPLEPRQLGYYNLQKDTLVLGPDLGNNLVPPFFTGNFDNDRGMEITGSVSSPGNYRDSVYITDHSAWFMVYDQFLNFKFEPVEFPGPLSKVSAIPVRINDKTYYACCYRYLGTVLEESAILYVFNAQGEKIKKIDLQHAGMDYSYTCFKGITDSTLYVKSRKGKIVTLDFNAFLLDEVVNRAKLNGRHVLSFDLNADQHKEFLFIDTTGYFLTVTNEQFKPLARFKSDVPLHLTEFQEIKSNDERKKLVYYSDGNEYEIVYRKNPLYILELAQIPMVFLISLGIVVLINAGTQYRNRKNTEKDRELTRLQLLSLKNQFDPHFTYNIINTLGGVIYKDDKEKAYKFLTRFSSLLRLIMNTSDQIVISLEDEIQMVREYLELQLHRFDSLFHYEISIDKDIDIHMKVPRLIIQTFAENAVKHGFIQNEAKGGLLTIACLPNGNSTVLIRVRDNGVGRSKAKKNQRNSTGLGLATLNKFLTILNENNRQKIYYKINDLMDENNNPLGTSIELVIPEKYLYSTL
jgi:two-component sensor histidine kinase